MKLDSITVENFRCFERLQIDLHPELTILLAPNGQGKTTLLDAARASLWPFVKAFDLANQTGKSATIQSEDVRLSMHSRSNMEVNLPARITTSGSYGTAEAPVSWAQQRESIKRATSTKYDSAATALTQYGKQLQTAVRNSQNTTPVELPVIIYLGTGRLWYQGRYTPTKAQSTLTNDASSRLWGYQNCLTAASSYKQFEDWYSWIYRSYRELQIQQLEQPDNTALQQQLAPFLSAIQTVTSAVNEVTQAATGWANLSYSSSQNQQLVMEHPEKGSMPLSMLSDGLRNMVSMVADIAFRCIKLNPQHGAEAARLAQGVVMIDEVDMFLHPGWQQTIIGSLRTAFPGLQFIVTTHSPQLITAVRAENIRILEETEQGYCATQPDYSPLAHESGDALAYIMGTHPRPQLGILETAHAYEQQVRNGQEDSAQAQQIKAELDDAGYQVDERDLDTWRFLAARRGNR